MAGRHQIIKTLACAAAGALLAVLRRVAGGGAAAVGGGVLLPISADRISRVIVGYGVAVGVKYLRCQIAQKRVRFMLAFVAAAISRVIISRSRDVDRASTLCRRRRLPDILLFHRQAIRLDDHLPRARLLSPLPGHQGLLELLPI